MKSWMMPFDEVFDLLGYRFRRNGEKYSGRTVMEVEGFTHLESSECALEPGDSQEEESCKVALT